MKNGTKQQRIRRSNDTTRLGISHNRPIPNPLYSTQSLFGKFTGIEPPSVRSAGVLACECWWSPATSPHSRKHHPQVIAA
jgi:hypothetical protein